MFEYLMPQLIMPIYENTLLYQTNIATVNRQIEYAEQRNVPWGISESGYNSVDAHMNYQYRAFGVPGLGLKRGLEEDSVIAPYATALALMVSPEKASENLTLLSEKGFEENRITEQGINPSDPHLKKVLALTQHDCRRREKHDAGKAATARLAADLAPSLAAGDLLLLDGPLGAGKTFFTRALARALGLGTSTRVTSPTFTLVHEYPTAPPLVHADLYRLSDDERGVFELGLVGQRDDGALLVVEWGLPFERLLGGDALVMRLAREPRSATFSATGPRSRRLLEALARIEVE